MYWLWVHDYTSGAETTLENAEDVEGMRERNGVTDGLQDGMDGIQDADGRSSGIRMAWRRMRGRLGRPDATARESVARPYDGWRRPTTLTVSRTCRQPVPSAISAAVRSLAQTSHMRSGRSLELSLVMPTPEHTRLLCHQHEGGLQLWLSWPVGISPPARDLYHALSLDTAR